MPTDQSSIRKSVITSNQAFAYAIRMIPFVPCRSSMTLHADDLQQEDERYLERCIESKVIPYSYIKLSYARDAKTFMVESNKPLVGIYRDPPNINQMKLTSMLRGGRISEIDLEIKLNSFGGFEHLRSEFLERLLANDYKISDADFWFSSKHENGYANGRLRLESRHGMSLELIDPQCLGVEKDAKEKNIQLVKWFKDIA